MDQIHGEPSNQELSLPNVIQIEQAVLGTLLLESQTIHTVASNLHKESFYGGANAIIYGTMLDMFGNSEPIDLLTITNTLRKKKLLDKVGGAYYLTKLTTAVNSSAHIEYHTALIKEAWIKRKLIERFDKIIKDCYADEMDSFQLLDKAASTTNQITETIYKSSSRDLKKVVYNIIDKATYNAQGHVLLGVPSGIPSLDQFTSGWKAPDFIVIAARPSMGKTAFVLQVALNAATMFGKKVAIFSLEMSVEQCVQRLLSNLTDIGLSQIIKGQVSIKIRERLESLGEKLITGNLTIDDTAGITILELRAKCHVIKNTKGLDMIVVDYIQLMEAEGKTREQEIAKISRGLKALAKEFDVPVIALSQLSRAVEARGGDKKPILSDLRESGAIEQDADMVGFLYRPEYYNLKQYLLDNEQISTQNLALLIWEKNRNGPLDELPLKFIGKFTKFLDWDIPKKLIESSQPLLDYTEPLKDQVTGAPF